MTEQIKFMLDGTEVTAAQGETIWDVAKRNGTEIPHLCHKDQMGYNPDGNCRACVVEIDGERTLAASCCRNATNGMVVKTTSERAIKSRAMVMELLLADQPNQDQAHDKSSHLWDMAKANGVAKSRFPSLKKEHIPLLDDSHVAMRVNLDACIQCGLCVRACRDVQVNDVIGMAGRGHDAYPTFDFGDPMGDSTCVACGECVQACPTGALMPASVVDSAQLGDRMDFDKEVQSICPFCGVGCPVSVRMKENKVV
jgi:formate dehydrogenase major subunit